MFGFLENGVSVVIKPLLVLIFPRSCRNNTPLVLQSFCSLAVWSHMVHALHCTQFFVGWKNMTGFKVHQENPDSELSSYLMLDMVKCSYIN